MNLMKSICPPLCGAMFLLLTLVACTGNDVPVSETDLPIRWSVQSENIRSGRALIENRAALQTACSAGGQAIGIWSAYQREGEGLTQQVLGTTGDASLTYETEGNWTYGEKLAYWRRNAEYYFNAYFPKDGMTGISHTTTSLAGTYDTETTQEDLMVSRVQVDTSADYFRGAPVNLSMVHALAAIKFVFLIEDSDATRLLKSFSLDKTLKTKGALNYNTDAITIANWTGTSSANESRIYEWADGNGVSFTATEEAVPYTTEENAGGHLFIIPQSCTTAPTFNCTIGTNATDNVTFQNISLGTTLFEPGKNYIYTIKVNVNVLHVELSIKAWNEMDTSYNIDF